MCSPMGGVVIVFGAQAGREESRGGVGLRRAVVDGLDGLADHVGFADPRALGVRETDRDNMASGLQFADERVDVGRRVRRGRTVVVDHEDMHLR